MNSEGAALVWSGSDDEFDWEDMTAELTTIMGEVNPNSIVWHGEVENFGWRNQKGSLDFDAKNGAQFLSAILPDTDNHFVIFNDKDKIRIENAHHDSPMGGEWYTITPKD